MRGYGEILLGLLLAALGVAGIWYFWEEVLVVILGIIGIFVLLVGVVFLMIGVSDMREKEEEIDTGETGAESEKEYGD